MHSVSRIRTHGLNNQGDQSFISIIEDIETSSGLFGITQAFALLHVVSRQGRNLFFSFERNVCTLDT